MVKITNGKEFEAVASSAVENNSIFLDSSDNVIKIKDNSGATINIVSDLVLYASLSGASYDSISFSVNSQETSPTGMFFNSDGTKVYIIGTTNNTVYQYTLSTPWVVSSASYDSKSFDASGQSEDLQTVFLSSDGSKMYTMDIGSGDSVYQYTLSTPGDISTATYDSKSLSVQAKDGYPTGITFNSDGSKMYMVGRENIQVHQYNLSSSWDISTAVFNSSGAGMGAQDSSPQAVFFEPEGSKMYVVGDTNNTVYQYSLSIPWDLSTIVYNSINFSVSSQETGPKALYFKADASKMYIIGSTNKTIYQYSTIQKISSINGYTI